MTRQRIRPIEIGEIYEISTARGFVYAQVTHKHPTLGWVVWVLPGLQPARPADLAPRVERDDGFFSFAPIDALVADGAATFVEAAAVPTSRSKFPLFRGYLTTDPAGRARDHRLWDGDRTWSIGDRLTVDQSKIPLRRVPSPALFIERLEEGWRPELHEEQVIAERRRSATQKGTASRRPVRTKHYLYFSSEELARRATDRIASMGGSAELRASAIPGEWLVLASAPALWARDRAALEFTQVASELDGRYDGAETEIA